MLLLSAQVVSRNGAQELTRERNTCAACYLVEQPCYCAAVLCLTLQPLLTLLGQRLQGGIPEGINAAVNLCVNSGLCGCDNCLGSKALSLQGHTSSGGRAQASCSTVNFQWWQEPQPCCGVRGQSTCVADTLCCLHSGVGESDGVTTPSAQHTSVQHGHWQLLLGMCSLLCLVS